MGLDETLVVLDLGRYDAESQATSLSAKGSSQVQLFDWELELPPDKAKQFKQSVESSTVKIRAKATLYADNQKAVIDSAMVKDLVQNLSYQTPVMVMVTSSPKGGKVWGNSRQKGRTPLKVGLAIGSNRVEVNFKPTFLDVGKEWQKFKIVQVKEGEPTTVHFDFGSDPPPLIFGEDGAEMVLIPARKKPFGEKLSIGHRYDAQTSAFYMDIYEVTNAQYRDFLQATRHGEPEYWNDSKFNVPNQPVVGVTWPDAVAYCDWAGKRLPTENEWEWADRGSLKGKKYPWGNQAPNSSRANYDKNVGETTPVGSYPVNGYGLYDMAGNVREWCRDCGLITTETERCRGAGLGATVPTPCL